MAKIQSAATISSLKWPILRCVAWLVLAGVWVLAAASLVSYHPADPPSHAYGVTNWPVKNWVGQVGALVAYQSYLLIGPGAWVVMVGLAVALVAVALQRPINQVGMRAVGIGLVAVATSCLIGMGLPALLSGYKAAPEIAGGLLAMFLNDQLIARFAAPGTTLILIVGFSVGAILAADQWIAAIPHTVGRALMCLADLRLPKLAMPEAGFLSLRWWRGGVIERVRFGHGGVPLQSNRRRRLSHSAESIDADTGGFTGAEPFDHDVEAVCKDPSEDATDDTPDLLGTDAEDQNRFSADELRAKIAKMRINLAPRTTQVTPPPRDVDLSGYEFPSLCLLEHPESNFTSEMAQIVRNQAVQLESALGQYRIEGEVVGIDSGPTITLFEVRLAPGTKVSSLNTISSDLARALRAQNIRIVPNMAGRDTVGIEVPNLKKELVRLCELMTTTTDSVKKMRLPMFLGKDASGNPLVADLTTMPHMLIAGTTGSGKSVCMNSIIMSFLFTRRPDEVKLVLVDPKMVEMSLFRAIPHLMCPVVTEMGKAAAILEWAVTKMDDRYELLSAAGVRDIASYNDLSWDEIKDRIEPASDAEEARIPRKLPFLVFVIDELADLIMTHKDVEGHIVRIAQKARAVGIHLILATQRPQANVVTGLIKSNMPCRICFKVASGMDSRIVLDSKGGELLLGQGDMLFLSPRSSKVTRAQGCLVDDFEIRQTVKFIKTVSQQNFEPQLVQLRSGDAKDVDEETARDPLFAQAVSIVLESKRGSVSLLQRRLTIGYSRASRLIEAMAAASILGEHKGSQARQVTMTLEEWEAMQAQAEADAELSGDGLPSPAGVELEPSPDTGAELEEIDEQDAGEEDEEYEEESDHNEQLDDDEGDYDEDDEYEQVED